MVLKFLITVPCWLMLQTLNSYTVSTSVLNLPGNIYYNFQGVILKCSLPPRSLLSSVCILLVGSFGFFHLLAYKERLPLILKQFYKFFYLDCINILIKSVFPLSFKWSLYNEIQDCHSFFPMFQPCPSSCLYLFLAS